MKTDYMKEWRKTPVGVINTIYHNQKINSSRRGHKTPCYSLGEFAEWMNDNGFRYVYMSWVHSGYDKNMKPSCDRLDDSLPYSLERIRLCTWKENNNKARQHQREGKLRASRKLREVKSENEDGHIEIYLSLHDASRKTGASAQHICGCCKGRRAKAMGYKWSYA
jgi:hypothetical protein